MQQRIPIANYSTYAEAKQAKIDLLIQYPDNNYQIRTNGTKFKLVHRFSVNELKAKEVPNVRKRVHKRRPRQLLSQVRS